MVSQPAEECTKINYTVVAVLLLPSVSSNTIFLSRIQRLICQETYRIYLHKRMRRAHKEQECCEKKSWEDLVSKPVLPKRIILHLIASIFRVPLKKYAFLYFTAIKGLGGNAT